MRHIPRLPALLLAALLLTPSLSAQITNGGFDEWDQRHSTSMPEGWTTGTFGSGRVADSSHPSAVAIWNWYYYALGLLAVGEWDPFQVNVGDLMQVRRPAEMLPVRLRGSYRYIQGLNKGRSPDAVDSGLVHILATRWNPSTSAADTVVSGMWVLTASDEWREFSIDLGTSAANPPDSIAVVFASSGYGFCSSDSGTCCYLYLDDVTFESVAGVSLPLLPSVRSRVAPNPVTSHTTISFESTPGPDARLRIIDVRGATLRTVEVTGREVQIEREGLPSGRCGYLLEDARGRAVATGWFVVAE